MILKNQVLSRNKQKPIVWDAFFNPDGTQKPLVIFCHGYKGFKDWGSWNLVAKEFSKEQLFFVKFNFSHNGGTVENPIDFPDLEAFAENNYTKELNDLDAMLNYILSEDFEYKNEFNRNDITLIGHSRGGGISIIKASEDSRITKLITWASVSDYGSRFGTNEDIKDWQKDGVKYVLNGRTKQQMPHNFQFYEDYMANQNRLNIQNATKNLKVPLLIIHGKEDAAVAFSEAENLSTWNTKSELFPLEMTNHVFNSKHPWEAKNLSPELNIVTQKSIRFVKKESH